MSVPAFLKGWHANTHRETREKDALEGSCVLESAGASANGKQLTGGCWEDELLLGSWELNPEPHTY